MCHWQHDINLFKDVNISFSRAQVLVVGDFNARVGTYLNMEVDDSVMVSDSTHDSKNLLYQIMAGFLYTCLIAQT